MSQSRLLSTADGGPASPPPSNFWQWLAFGTLPQAPSLAFVVHHQSSGCLSNIFAPSTSSSTSPSDQLGFRCSFGQLLDAVERFATILYAKGLREGHVVASFIGNDRSVEWALLLWASWRVGAVFAPVEPGLLGRSTELREVCKLLNPKVVVLNNSTDMRSWMENDMGDENKVIRLTCGENIDNDGNKWSSIAHLTCQLNCSSSPPLPVSGPTQPALIMFTSGTTSTPKGCRLTFANIHAEIAGHRAFASSSWSSAARFLVTTSVFRPLCYLGCLSSWTAGGSVIFTASTFDPTAVVEGVKAERATHLMMVPTQLHALINEFVQQQHSLEHELLFVTSAGDVSERELISNARQVLKPRRFVPHWGATEGSPLFGFSVIENTSASLPMLESGATGIGRALPGTKAKICLANESPPTLVPRGTRGELHVSSPALIQGYLGGVSSSSFYEDAQVNWFRTGDWAVMNDEGVVYVVGRIKDTIKCKGIGLFPPVIEGYLKDFFGIQATVVGVPDVEYGEKPVAILISMPPKIADEVDGHPTKTRLSSSNHTKSKGTEAIRRAMIRCVSDHLGTEYMLGAIYTLEELGLDDWPLNISGKLDKNMLRHCVVNKAMGSG